MTASPRPSRLQVDADLARVADADTCTDDLHRRLAAEVLDLRTELEAARVASTQIAEWRTSELAELERLRAGDDLARDVALWWRAGDRVATRAILGSYAAGLLDRLTTALLPDGPREMPRTRQVELVQAYHCAVTKALLRDREGELLKLKGPCRAPDCRLHFAHRGPCDEVPRG